MTMALVDYSKLSGVCVHCPGAGVFVRNVLVRAERGVRGATGGVAALNTAQFRNASVTQS